MLINIEFDTNGTFPINFNRVKKQKDFLLIIYVKYKYFIIFKNFIY